MKIEGTIHIFGMNEILFRQKYRGKFYVIVQYLRAKSQDKWIRVLGDEADGFYRDDESMIHSIKSLAFNPSVKLSFNDGIMFVDFLHESLTQREWIRLEKYTEAKSEEFVKALSEMIRS
jgi:hypothetical protein